jgi:hypothetical protein
VEVITGTQRLAGIAGSPTGHTASDDLRLDDSAGLDDGVRVMFGSSGSVSRASSVIGCSALGVQLRRTEEEQC